MIATAETVSESPRKLGQRLAAYTPAFLIIAGLIARLVSAHSKFLNADEAMHYLLSLQPSFSETYRASLGTTHPPLLIVLLHYWGMIAGNEFFLRLPSVIAGSAAGWFLYAWIRDVSTREAACIALALFLFSPALIYISAEVRQYSLLLCFMAAALYFLERALAKNSASRMLVSAAFLYLAVLTHYCALIFALSIAAYGLLRVAAGQARRFLLATWTFTQLGWITLFAFLWKTHIAVIRHKPLTQDVAQSYLRNSLFHRGEENVLAFLAKESIRLFHFLFSQGAISVLGLAIFIIGLVVVFRTKDPGSAAMRPRGRQLGFLLLLPFAINFIAALADVYPYGGTRHNAYLAIFAMPPIAIAVARWNPKWKWAKAVAVGAALLICNFTVTPAGAYIKPKNQKRELMEAAVHYLRVSAPPGSAILTDYESGLLLSYYLCNRDITHRGEPLGSFYQSRCGEYETVSLLPRLWVFRSEAFPAQIGEVAKTLRQGQQLWLFQAGFIVDREPEFQALLGQNGCPNPRTFGRNILVCQISPELNTQNKRRAM